MSSSFLEAAAARVPTAGRGAGLIDSPTFWTVEAGAPLLRRNAGFLTAEGPPHGWRERLDRWPELLSASTPAPAPSERCDDEAALRIFLRDAERTFQHASHRERMIGALKRLWPEEKDYHQGLGYVCSLLLLFFDEETACAMLLRLARDPAYTPGYWRAAPEPYVRDAMVFARLVERRFPEVAALLQAACVVPEAYASKWYIGLCVHVLPFEALLPFVEGFFRDGYPFLFRFSLALVAAVSPRLLVLKPTDVNLILEIMRLDVCQYPDDYEGGQFFTRLVADAASVDLENAEIDSLREEEAVKLAEKMRKVKEREAQLAAEASDDEIVFSDEEID
mmetsp:Transcript_9047/g.18880  ORF Transcript_9047/g.18880 Transcript_9047/m.18880 type:complete len:335 (-) Transcript_9047:388-1392(-)